MSTNPVLKDALANYDKARLAERDGSYDDAFKLYLTAAQAYMRLARGPAEARAQAEYKMNAGRCLERAERIKAAKKDAVTVVRDPFSEEEQSYILDKSSRLNELRYPPWSPGKSTPVSEHLCPSSNVPQDDTLPGPQSNLDKSQPDLISTTEGRTARWRRPQEVYNDLSIVSPSLLPDEIIQNVITNCSVCASIAICVDHHRKFGSKIGFSNSFPQNASQLPEFSLNGIYEFRFFINGTLRRIVVDDHLPFFEDDSPMFMTTTRGFNLWPCIIEKAYMKLMGGYDFPGSNSSADLHVIAGWIPEHIELQSPSFESERTWSRIISAFTKGQCVLTLGTGQQNRRLSLIPGVSLLPTHCYAVVDVSESDDEHERQVTILTHNQATIATTPPTSLDEQIESLTLDGRNQRIMLDWTDVCNIFEGIYLSWDPAPYTERLEFHGLWKARGPKGGPGVHHQLWLNTEKLHAQDELLVLLTRHTVDKRRENEYIAILVQQEDSASLQDRASHALLKNNTYTSSSYALSRHVLVEPGETLSINALYDGPHDDVAFTVTVYGKSKLSWIRRPERLPFTNPLGGSFTSKNAGGNNTFPTFRNNPQWRIRFSPNKQSQGSANRSKANIRILAEGPKDVPLNACIVWSKGERVSNLVQSDILANSGPYSFGLAHCEAQLTPGDYTVILSTFEPRHRGVYSVMIESSAKLGVDEIPMEGAGMFCKTISSAWNDVTAAGSPSFGKYTSNPTYALTVKTSTKIQVRLQPTKPSSTLPLNITVFTAGPSGNLGRQVATSGPYADATSGVITSLTPLSSGKYALVPSTYDPGVKAAFQMFIYTSTYDVVLEAVK